MQPKPTDTIAILIPTYGRAKLLTKLIDNLKATTKGRYKAYFVIEQDDSDTVQLLDSLEETIIYNEKPNTYVSAINLGYRTTTEKYVFCASDDVVFSDGWDLPVRELLKKYGFVGVKDSWEITKTGKHASHFAVQRSYIESMGGVEDEPDTIYSSVYKHFMCDIETEQTAMKRGQFVVADSWVEHEHWINEKREKDNTYTKEGCLLGDDMASYCSRRKRFEQYLFDPLFGGKIVPVNKQTLSVVLASYNSLNYLKNTINSLYANTYHDFELIIIDDASDQIVKRYITDLQREYGNIRAVFNTKNQYVTAVWNKGLSMAKGDCIAVINNDITFSKHWDTYLMAELQKKDVYMANPYQTDDGYSGAYGKHDRAGGIDIRGACWVIKRETYEKIGKLPSELLIWFSDYWLAEQVVTKHKKKSVFAPESVIHHAGSRSSLEMQELTGVFYWILRGDAYAFKLLTGIDVQKWIDIINKRSGLT